ncbi:dnaJ homolog subfamily C member 28, partial [Octopus bimaculoides]
FSLQLSSNSFLGHKRKNNSIHLENYNILNVNQKSTAEEVRESYIRLAKKFHPDSGSENANPEKFAQIQDAYYSIMRNLQQHQVSKPEIPLKDEDSEKIERLSPHHRHYLSFEGIGSGTPTRRERQYRQHQIRRAAENIFQYRIEKYGETEDSAMVVKDKKATRKHKISNTIDRVVEDLIQDAMSKGEFHNLSGAGKPIVYKNVTTTLDSHTHRLNQVLINNGYSPEWITMMKEIREHVALLRHNIAMHYTQGPTNLTAHAVEKFQTGIRDINVKIDKYNMIVPILRKQMVHYDCGKELSTVQAKPHRYINPELNKISAKVLAQKDALHSDPINWSQVWKDIKAVFK